MENHVRVSLNFQKRKEIVHDFTIMYFDPRTDKQMRNLTGKKKKKMRNLGYTRSMHEYMEDEIKVLLWVHDWLLLN